MHLTDLATPPNRLLASRSTCRASLLVGTAISVLRFSATMDWQAVWIAWWVLPEPQYPSSMKMTVKKGCPINQIRRLRSG